MYIFICTLYNTINSNEKVSNLFNHERFHNSLSYEVHTNIHACTHTTTYIYAYAIYKKTFKVFN